MPEPATVGALRRALAARSMWDAEAALIARILAWDDRLDPDDVGPAAGHVPARGVEFGDRTYLAVPDGQGRPGMRPIEIETANIVNTLETLIANGGPGC